MAAIAEKSVKEIRYHLKWSAEWVIRLGDGTETSHQKMQEAVDNLWMFAGELTTPSEADRLMAEAGVAPDLLKIKSLWEQKVAAILEEATLKIPENTWMQRGGKEGRHTEQLGYILAEMQHLQRSYPGNEW